MGIFCSFMLTSMNILLAEEKWKPSYNDGYNQAAFQNCVSSGGDFDGCDAKIIGPDKVCVEFQALYRVDGYPSDCGDVAWNSPILQKTLGRKNKNATVYSGDTGKWDITATASGCKCGNGSKSVKIVPESFFDKTDKVDRLKSLIDKYGGKDLIESYENALSDLGLDPFDLSATNRNLYFAMKNLAGDPKPIERDIAKQRIMRSNVLSALPKMGNTILTSIPKLPNTKAGYVLTAKTAYDLVALTSFVKDAVGPCSSTASLKELTSKINIELEEKF